MAEQAGLLYYIAEQYVAVPHTTEGLRLFRRLSDGLYYVKHSDNTIELFSAGIGPVIGNNSIFEETIDSGNAGNAETDLYLNQVNAGLLNLIGDTINAEYAIILADTLNAKVIRMYFAGIKIFESIVDYSTGQLFNLKLNLSIIRIDLDSVKTIVSYVGTGVEESQINQVDGVNFANANGINLTGQGVANNDIIAKFDKGIFVPKS